MNKQTVSKNNRGGAAGAAMMALVATTGALALAGCEQHPYPTPAPDESAAPPPPPSPLMGAPTGPDGQPVGPDGYPPPQGQPYPGGPGGPPQGPGPGYAQAGPPPGPGYPAGGMFGSPGYAGGPRPPCPPDASQQGPDAPSVIVCSAPVPNPPEDEASPHPWRRHHHHGWFAHGYAPAYDEPAPEEAYVHHRHYRAWRRREAAATSGYGYVLHHRHRYRIEGLAPFPGTLPYAHRHPGGSHVAPLATPPAAHSHPAAAKPHSRSAHPGALAPNTKGGAAKTPSAGTASSSNSVGENTTSANTTGGETPAATEAQRYTALQTALASVIASEARLDAPAHFDPNQSADVSLTIPSDFAQTVRTEAAKQDLSEQAASVNLTAALTGAGYTVTPEQAQSQPLTLGQATVFHWKVTAQPNAKGPLQSDLRADILSDGKSLPLGTIGAATAGKWTGRVIGVGLLVLIALVILAWAAQRRRPKSATGATRPRDTHQNGN